MIKQTQLPLPPQEFDAGTTTAAADIRQRMADIQIEFRYHDFDLEQIMTQAQTAVATDAASHLARLHDAAGLLFLLWQQAQLQPDKTETLALARLFNGLTRTSRALDAQFQLLDKTHLDQLTAQLANSQQEAEPDPEQIAAALNEAAQTHTHERAWPWVVLPTFPRQAYGRILLRKVETGHKNAPIFVTQPFFLAGMCTLFHTHGQNWAISRPLGNQAGHNVHINTLWQPKQPDDPFPLRQLDLAEYCCGSVVAIPPRVIHGISKKRTAVSPLLPRNQLLADSTLWQPLVTQSRFGEGSCLHIYYPHMPLAESLRHSPLLQQDAQFFMEYDMIVFDHFAEDIWAGGGGSWARRMIEYGGTGDHCGLCYENDSRRENLDPGLVSKWFVATPPPPLLQF